MLLIVFGVFCVLTGELKITHGYGVSGKGAYIGGIICILFGLGVSHLVNTPIQLLLEKFDLPSSAGLAISAILQISIFSGLLITLVRVFGNSFKGKKKPSLSEMQPK